MKLISASLWLVAMLQTSVIATPPGPPGCWQTLDFNDLQAGTYITDEKLVSNGVEITAKKKGNRGYTPTKPYAPGSHNSNGGGAMVFDTFRPRGQDDIAISTGPGAGPKLGLCGWSDGDEDLGAPNTNCQNIAANLGGHKPGHGAGGGPNSAYSNCDWLGNVLIIQESNKLWYVPCLYTSCSLLFTQCVFLSSL